MKTVIITGASSGIGLAVALELAKKQANVLCIGHEPKRSELALEQIRAAAPGVNARFINADLMQQREVLRVAAELSNLLTNDFGGKLDALINNAGCVRSWYTTTEEGYEQQFALNHLAGFLLTQQLLPFLKRANGRVILTGSGSHKYMRMRWNDVMLSNGYNPLIAYKQSKLCNMLFARGLNNRYYAEGIHAYVVDPGLVCTDIGNKNTGALVNWIWKLRKKHGVCPDIPAKTYVHLIEAEPAPQDLYFYLCKPNRYSREVTKGNADRLFALSERLCGVRFPEKISKEGSVI